MKTMRKLFALVLAMTMVLAMAVTAGAATVTINKALPGGKYIAYKLASVTTNADSSSYSYVSESAWEKFWSGPSFGMDAYFTTITDGDGNVIVTAKAGTIDAVAVANSAKSYANANRLTGTEIVAEAAATDTGAASAVFENLDAGYYLILSPKGSALILDTVVGDLELDEKNESLPNIEKTVNGTESVSAAIGEKVTFTLQVTAGVNTNNEMQYVIHDVLPAGLTANIDSIAVYHQDQSLTKGTDYTVTTGPCAKSITGCSFEIVFTNTLTTKTGETITVTYDATVDTDALSKNVNTAYITDVSVTDKDDAEVVTYQFSFDKEDSDGTALSGAEFKLYSNSECTTEVPVVANGENAYRVATETETGAAIVSAGATITVSGLKEGTYYLKETKAPDGYVLSTEAKAVTVSASEASVTFDFVNVEGEKLPETGGMGTTLFYIIGGLMVVSAAVLLVVKKRMTAE